MPRKKRGKKTKARNGTSGGSDSAATGAGPRAPSAPTSSSTPNNLLTDPTPTTSQLEEPLLPASSSSGAAADGGTATSADAELGRRSPSPKYTSFPRHRKALSEAIDDELIPLASATTTVAEPLEATLIADAEEFNVSFEAPSDINNIASGIVQIEAPATLPPNFTFVATLPGGRAFTVTTDPEGGGVQRGQILELPFPSSFLATTVVPPKGYWKDGLCDCLSLGCCHPTVWVSWLCPLVGIGQTNTRLRLDWLGRKATIPRQVKFTFGILVTITVLHIIAANIWSYLGHNLDPVYFKIGSSLSLCVMLFRIYSIARTRYQVRKRYEIPESACARGCCCGCCRSCDDVCAAALCSCCVTARMLRHTADYETYRGLCCSSNGLPASAPVVV